MKFKLSGFFYGMGTAIVVLSLVYYIVYNLDLRDRIYSANLIGNISGSALSADANPESLSNSQIEELARGIGMVFPSELDDLP